MLEELTKEMSEADRYISESACYELVNIKNIYRPEADTDFVGFGTKNGKIYMITVSEVDEDEL